MSRTPVFLATEIASFKDWMDFAVIANHGVVTAIYFTMSEEDVFRIIQDENVVVGTDGIKRTDSGSISASVLFRSYSAFRGVFSLAFTTTKGNRFFVVNGILPLAKINIVPIRICMGIIPP